MSAWTENDELLDRDPLAIRLASADVGHPSQRLRASVDQMRPLAERPVHRRRLSRRLSRGMAALAAALALLVVTPAGAALGRAILPDGLQQLLGLVVGAPTHLPPGGGQPATPSGSTSGQLPPGTSLIGGGGAIVRPSLSLAEAQRLVAFPIPQPRDLPSGLVFYGAWVDSTHSVFLHYADSTHQGGVGLEVRQGTAIGGSAVPAGSVREVAVGGSPAYFVHGSYADAGPGTVAIWDAAADVVELTWQRGGFTYNLTASGLHLSSSEAVQIAEAVR